MPRKTDGIEFEIHPRPTKGEHTDPKTIHGRDVRYAGIEFIPSKEFVKEGGQNREGYRKSEEPMGNSQMHDQQAMDEALRRSMRLGYTTIPEIYNLQRPET